MGSNLNKLQLQLGQITEMIHVASLIHDDVLDESETRRGGAAVHTVYTNKVLLTHLIQDPCLNFLFPGSSISGGLFAC
jgi:geranylgeranyl pyrophosphate synthase